MPLFRSAIVQLTQSCNTGATLDGTWAAAISSLVASLPSGTVIPDTTGLAGARYAVRCRRSGRERRRGPEDRVVGNQEAPGQCA